MDYNQKTLLELRQNEPDKFEKVLKEDCPSNWGLVDQNCRDYDCEDCWAEALKNVDNGKSV